MGGAWGNHWFVDPANGFSVVIMTNTAFEGTLGKFPADIGAAVYGSGAFAGK